MKLFKQKCLIKQKLLGKIELLAICLIAKKANVDVVLKISLFSCYLFEVLLNQENLTEKFSNMALCIREESLQPLEVTNVWNDVMICPLRRFTVDGSFIFLLP